MKLFFSLINDCFKNNCNVHFELKFIIVRVSQFPKVRLYDGCTNWVKCILKDLQFD